MGELVTLIILIISAGIAAWHFFASVRWNRRHYAHEIIRTWNDNVTDNRGNIMDTFGEAFIGHETLSEERCLKEIFSGNTDLLDEITRVINYHEGFATAYTRNIAERAMIKRSVEKNISLWYTVFENFIRMESCRRGYEPWGAYTDLMEMWEIEKEIVPDRNPSWFEWLDERRSKWDWKRVEQEFNKKSDDDWKTHAPKNCRRLKSGKFDGKPCLPPCFLYESHPTHYCYMDQTVSS